MKLAVIVGSTRQNRKTLQQAKWVAKNAELMEDVAVELVDLVDYPMPFFDEPISPRYNPNRMPAAETKKWLDKLAEFDAYIFVTAEYNHAMPAVLKNALDYVDFQFVRKPGAVISHGSAGGARAQVVLKEVLSESKLVLMPTAPSLHIVGMSEKFDEAGNLNKAVKADPYGPHPGLEELLENLKWYSDALSDARTQEVSNRKLETVAA